MPSMLERTNTIIEVEMAACFSSMCVSPVAWASAPALHPGCESEVTAPDA